jgi:hypothetical protein
VGLTHPVLFFAADSGALLATGFALTRPLRVLLPSLLRMLATLLLAALLLLAGLAGHLLAGLVLRAIAASALL